jgi:hypothetical protein
MEENMDEKIIEYSQIYHNEMDKNTESRLETYLSTFK